MRAMIDNLASQLNNPVWWVSQVFALIALITFVWGWQIKNKVRMMTLIGIASTALVISAVLLGNFSLGVLFGLAAIRNFVFAYLDWRKAKGKYVAHWLSYFFAVIFAISTITASTLFMTVPYLRQYVAVIGGRRAIWLEFFIMITLLGLILGNILKGTNLMRVSFVLNRIFNIINHVYFANLIAVIIATLSIGSNLIYYLRMLIRKIRGIEDKKISETASEEKALETEPITAEAALASQTQVD